MAILLAIPIFIGLTILQSGVLSHMRLLNGPVDLTLLVILAWSLQDRVKTTIEWSLTGGLIASLGTALPFGTLVAAYLLNAGLCLYIKRIFWKVPLLAMFTAAFLGTIILYSTSYIAVSIQGEFLPVNEVVNLVVLPSLLLNLLAALPVHFLVSDLANLIYPEE